MRQLVKSHFSPSIPVWIFSQRVRLVRRATRRYLRFSVPSSSSSSSDAAVASAELLILFGVQRVFVLLPQLALAGLRLLRLLSPVAGQVQSCVRQVGGAGGRRGRDGGLAGGGGVALRPAVVHCPGR